MTAIMRWFSNHKQRPFCLIVDFVPPSPLAKIEQHDQRTDPAQEMAHMKTPGQNLLQGVRIQVYGFLTLQCDVSISA